MGPTGTTAAGATVVVAQGLTKVYRDFWHRPRARAVDDLDFVVQRGEVFGLLGPNGSGKSTTIKMILGLLRKTSGRLAVFGKPPSDVQTKRRIGLLPEESYLYPFLTARETLDFYARLFGLDYAVRKRRAAELLDMVGLGAAANRQVGEFSKGMRRRIGLAQALLNDPEFLILDEPTTGLDPIGTRQVKDLILELGARGKTILLSSHQLADVEDCVDRTVVLYGGKKRAQGTCDELLTAQHRTRIEIDAIDDGMLERVRDTLEEGFGIGVHAVDKPRQKLEEFFVDLVERALQERLGTSGAGKQGETAAFLRDQTAGSELVEELVDATREEDQQRDGAVLEPQTPPKTTETIQDDALASLIQAYETAPAGPGAAETAPAQTPTNGRQGPLPPAPKGADTAFIDGLLGGENETETKPESKSRDRDA